MKTTFSINFYCRKCKQNTKGLSPVEVRITQNGTAFLLSLPRKANPDEFKIQMASRKQTNIKAYTSAVASKIEELQVKLLWEGKSFTREILKNYIYYGFTQQHYTVGAMFQGFLVSQMKKVDAGLSTYKNYRKYEIVRDLFLFQCFTAISYCDMMALTPEDYKTNEYGHVYIVKQRAKTKVKFCAILFEDALAIAKKYDWKLPRIVLQNYNMGLKTIGDICKINKPMHSHIGRHTAACYLLNEMGLSIEIVARILGHSSTKITRHYAKLMDRTVFEGGKRRSP